MNIGWLCPFIEKPGIVVGAIVESESALNGRSEWIPVVLPETPLGTAMVNGPAWVILAMGSDFFAFSSKAAAEAFLFDTFEAYMHGVLSVRMCEELVDKYNGEARNASEYGVVFGDDFSDLN